MKSLTAALAESIVIGSEVVCLVEEDSVAMCFFLEM